MSKTKPVHKGITIDRSKLLGFDQLSRAKPQALHLLSKVGMKKPPTS